MATATMNLSSLPGKPNKKGVSLAPERERYMQACADVAHHLIQLHEEDSGGKDVNLNALRGQIAKKYKLKMIPPLTAIIAAIPEHYKKYIVPKLVAKPIRTAYLSRPLLDSYRISLTALSIGTSSGIAVVAVMCKPHRCPHIAYVGTLLPFQPVVGFYVFIDRKHLRILSWRTGLRL